MVNVPHVATFSYATLAKGQTAPKTKLKAASVLMACTTSTTGRTPTLSAKNATSNASHALTDINVKSAKTRISEQLQMTI